MGDFPQVNAIMGQYFTTPYPARAAVQVAALPKGVSVEMDAILARP
jgi:enamine deaminase RidA (YjgF/YER057c/UK114 family)